jgi:hypothetical protein
VSAAIGEAPAELLEEEGSFNVEVKKLHFAFAAASAL